MTLITSSEGVGGLNNFPPLHRSQISMEGPSSIPEEMGRVSGLSNAIRALDTIPENVKGGFASRLKNLSRSVQHLGASIGREFKHHPLKAFGKGLCYFGGGAMSLLGKIGAIGGAAAMTAFVGVAAVGIAPIAFFLGQTHVISDMFKWAWKAGAFLGGAVPAVLAGTLIGVAKGPGENESLKETIKDSIKKELQLNQAAGLVGAIPGGIVGGALGIALACGTTVLAFLGLAAKR